MTRRFPRRDPYQLFHIQSDFAAGLTPQEIATKNALPVPAVKRVLRAGHRTDGLVSPFQLARRSSQEQGAVQVYWLGYIAAAGRLYPQGPATTLVLDVDPRDVDHIEVLVADLCAGRPSRELCVSSHRGLQAYIRDRELGELLSEWGIPGVDRTEGSVPLSFIPRPLLPHFLRGYLEGGRGVPPFGGRATPASLGAVRTVALVGPETFITGLRRVLRRHLGVGAGTVRRRRSGLFMVTYRGDAARRIVRFAYRNPSRSLPRAARLLRSLQARPAGQGDRRPRRNGPA